MALRVRLLSRPWCRLIQQQVGRMCATSSTPPHQPPTAEEPAKEPEAKVESEAKVDPEAQVELEAKVESEAELVAELKANPEDIALALKSIEQEHYEVVNAKVDLETAAEKIIEETMPWRTTEAYERRDAALDIRPPEDEDQSLIPIEERRPRATFPVAEGETPTASNWVIPIPPPPVPVNEFFQDQDLPPANMVTSAFEATSPIYDNKRDVPFQAWFVCEHGEVGNERRPIIVPSLYDKRIATCLCAPQDTSIIYYILVHRGYMSRCPNCGNCFVLMSEKNHEVRKGV